MPLVVTTLVAQHQRALRYRAGRPVACLEPGAHHTWFPGAGDRDELVDVSTGVTAWGPEHAVVPPELGRRLDVPHRAIGVVSVDGVPVRAVPAGPWLVWSAGRAVSVAVFPTTERLTTIPETCWPLLPPGTLQDLVVLPHERILLYVDGALDRVLGPGRYGVHLEGRAVAPVRVDLREQELTVAGQECMTADKVTLRLNLLARFRVVDPTRALSEVENLRDGLYALAQLAARQLVGEHALDALLDGRVALSARLREQVAPRAAGWGVELVSLDLKDVVLPGEVKAALHQVLEAVQRAAAQVVLRREEVAATRSLANTAKLMEQNPTLLRLKELEVLERVAAQVGQVTVVATPGELLRTLSLPA